MNGISGHLADRIQGWLNDVESVSDGRERCWLAIRGQALAEMCRGTPWCDRVNSALQNVAKTGANGDEIEQFLRKTAQNLDETPSSKNPKDDAQDQFFTVLEALIVAERNGGGSKAGCGQASALFNRAITHLSNFQEAAALAEDQMHWAMRWGRWPAVFCASVARTGWAVEDDLDGELEEEAVGVGVGAFEPIEVFARRATPPRGRAISLKDLAKSLERVPWWCLRSDFRRLRISIVVKSSVLKLEVFEGEETKRTSESLDGTAVRARWSERDEAVTAINKGVAQLRLGERVDAGAFELRVRRVGDERWVEIFGSEQAGAGEGKR